MSAQQIQSERRRDTVEFDETEYEEMHAELEKARDMHERLARVEATFERIYEHDPDHHNVDWKRNAAFRDAEKEVASILFHSFAIRGHTGALAKEIQKLELIEDEWLHMLEKQGE